MRPDDLLPDLLGHVRLACVPGIGSRLRRLLLERFGTPDGVFAASPAEIASVGRIGPKLAAAIPSLAESSVADDVIALCRKRSVDILLEGRDGYPPLLSRIDDPPGLLFVRGTLLPQDSLSVAIVGARHATAADGRSVASAAELQLGDIERQVLDACDALAGGASRPVSIDDVVDSSGLAASQVLATVGVLEMRRLIRRLPGNQIVRN